MASFARSIDEAVFGASAAESIYGPKPKKAPAATKISPAATAITADLDRSIAGQMKQRKKKRFATAIGGDLGELSLGVTDLRRAKKLG